MTYRILFALLLLVFTMWAVTAIFWVDPDASWWWVLILTPALYSVYGSFACRRLARQHGVRYWMDNHL